MPLARRLDQQRARLLRLLRQPLAQRIGAAQQVRALHIPGIRRLFQQAAAAHGIGSDALAVQQAVAQSGAGGKGLLL